MSEIKDRTLMSFDWAMKSVLKDPENFDVLAGFLAALLDDDKIEILEILESESTQNDESDKFNRVDLKAKDKTGKIIIVELQYSSESDYLARINYGTSKAVSEHMRLGYAYGQIPKVISISIVYFNLMKEKGSYAAKSETIFRDINTSEQLASINNKANFPEYYIIQPEWFDDNIKTALDEWVYVFKHSAVKEGSKSKSINRVKEALDLAKMSPEERSAFDYYWNISKRSAINVLKAARDEERIKRAKALLDVLDIKIITEKFELTDEEVEDLKKDD